MTSLEYRVSYRVSGLEYRITSHNRDCISNIQYQEGYATEYSLGYVFFSYTAPYCMSKIFWSFPFLKEISIYLRFEASCNLGQKCCNTPPPPPQILDKNVVTPPPPPPPQINVELRFHVATLNSGGGGWCYNNFCPRL